MIIRNNLATNPVKNYSLFLLACMALVIIAVTFTLFNVRSLTGWYSESARLKQNIQEQEKKRNNYLQQAVNLENRIAKIRTKEFVAEAQFMNNAIRRRVFSWTRLFDLFESTLPNNVKMISIAPSIREDSISISMEVAGRSLNDLVELMHVLQQGPAFTGVVIKSERLQKDGLLFATISLQYRPDKLQQGPSSPKGPSIPELEETGLEKEEGGAE